MGNETTNEKIRQMIRSSFDVKERIAEDEQFAGLIARAVSVCMDAFRNGNSVYFCGNGGSAADAQHLAAELSGRFCFDRDPLPAEALHVNTSFLTAVANDYGYDQVYSRMVKAIGRKGDVLFGLSTSGNSPNIVKALEMAKDTGMTTIGLTGGKEGGMDRYCDYVIKVPAEKTPRIQEAHIMIGHIICELIEEGIFNK